MEGFRVKRIIRDSLDNSNLRIERWLNKTDGPGCKHPIMTASNIHYEIGDRTHGISVGGIGTFHVLTRQLGLIDAIDRRLSLLKMHLPYHESDHVLSVAYLALCGGSRWEALELLRHDEVFLDALGARRIPDPTTAGDFCRRFNAASIQILQDVIDDTRIRAWAGQPAAFFERAILDMDGTLVGTTGQCKRVMDIGYDGTWGYHPLGVSLAKTGEAVRVVNRPSN